MDERLDQAEAQRKLKAFGAKLGYPDKWKDYSALTIVRNDLAGNVRGANEWNSELRRHKLGGPDRQDRMGHDAANQQRLLLAAAERDLLPGRHLDARCITIRRRTWRSELRQIGATIGHEMSHGFDDQGRKSDSKGVMRDWWTKEDAARYTKEANKLVAQYAQYSPVPGIHLNGQQTLGREHRRSRRARHRLRRVSSRARRQAGAGDRRLTGDQRSSCLCAIVEDEVYVRAPARSGGVERAQPGEYRSTAPCAMSMPGTRRST